MSRLHVSLSDVPSEVRCVKPGCTVASHTRLQRHHKRHQAMWLSIWAGRRRSENRWRSFVERYHQFLTEDVVLICDSHHAEIHSIYDRLISQDRAKTKIPFAKYSWRQADHLMDKLEKACVDWLARETPGIDSEVFGDTRAVYKSLLRKEAIKSRRP
jgi:hypothetical protein